MKLYFLRHGESAANLLHEFSNIGIRHPLTEKGLAQAGEAAHSLAGLVVEKVYASPVLRATQTARIVASQLKAPLEISEALREWNVGIYEGTSDPQGWELHTQVQEDWFIHGRLDSKMPGGESFNEICARFEPFINGLVQQWGKTDKQFVLVAHGGLYIAMLPHIFTNIDHAYAMQHGFDYTACAVAEPRPDGLYCLSWP